MRAAAWICRRASSSASGNEFRRLSDASDARRHDDARRGPHGGRGHARDAPTRIVRRETATPSDARSAASAETERREHDGREQHVESDEAVLKLRDQRRRREARRAPTSRR